MSEGRLRADATCLFALVNKRYQMLELIVLTSNKSFGQWDEIFPDTALASALLDRLLDHSTTITIRVESYRLRHRRQAGLAGPPLNAGATTPLRELSTSQPLILSARKPQLTPVHLITLPAP